MSGKPSITPLDAIVGANVQKLRLAKGMTQERLAEILECSDGLVSQLEQGKRAWKNWWIWKVIQEFGVTAAELFGGVEVPPEDRPLFDAIKERISLHKHESALKDEISARKRPSNRKKNP